MKIINNKTIDDLYGFTDISNLSDISGGSDSCVGQWYYGCTSGYTSDCNSSATPNGNGGWEEISGGHSGGGSSGGKN